MSEYIILPRSQLTDDLWRNAELGRLFLFLLSRVDENGEAVIDSGAAYKALGISRQKFRTLLGKLVSNHLLTTSATTNATTIKFDTQIVKSKRQPPKQPPQQPPSNHLMKSDDEYVDPLFADAWKLWLDYRQEIKNNYKTEKSKRIGYEQFIKKSNNDPLVAMEIVKNTIAYGYKGLFPERNNGTRSNTSATIFADRNSQREYVAYGAGEMLRAIGRKRSGTDNQI